MTILPTIRKASNNAEENKDAGQQNVSSMTMYLATCFALQAPCTAHFSFINQEDTFKIVKYLHL